MVDDGIPLDRVAGHAPAEAQTPSCGQALFTGFFKTGISQYNLLRIRRIGVQSQERWTRSRALSMLRVAVRRLRRAAASDKAAAAFSTGAGT